MNLKIRHIKNIEFADLEMPLDNGIYAFVGANGCGKSTLMQCMAQLISNQLPRFSTQSLKKDSSIQFTVGGMECIWSYKSKQNWQHKGHVIHYNGLYEGSLFYGTRFEDSTIVENLIAAGKLSNDKVADADEYVKKQLSYILHGDLCHYETLQRIKNRNIAQKLKIRNIPYFIVADGHHISQYKMSSGECLLISLLHFLYNSIVRRSLPENEKILVLIDELELALHPIAVLRLMDLLKDLVLNHNNLVVFLSTHSPEIIRTLDPLNLYRVNNESGVLSIENKCYPSYLIRDLYSPISPDYLFLVEDKLAQLVVDSILNKASLRNSKLIHCVPVGGWQNVLELHKELYGKKVLGVNTNIYSVLDGDIAAQLNKEQNKLPHLFIPIPSVEKFLYSVIVEKSNVELRRIINDKYFIVHSLDDIVSKYHRGTLNGASDNNKNFYKFLIKELETIGTKQELFIFGLCNDITENVNISNFIESLKKILK